MAENTVMRVELIPAAAQAVVALTEMTGLSRTDCMNRAVQLLRLLEEQRLAGKSVKLVDADGNVEALNWSSTGESGADHG